MSPLFNVPFADFSGLDLRDSADETPGAIDMLNVELDRPGRVRSRDGYGKVTAAAGATRYDSLFPVGGTAAVTSATAPAAQAVDDSSAGTVAWGFTAGALPATCALTPGQLSHYLKATNFGFAVPSTATIVGIVVTFTDSATVKKAIVESTVRLVKAGTVTGSNRSDTRSINLTSTASVYGSATDLWGTALLPADVNASTFGVVLGLSDSIAATASVSAISMTVYYQPQTSQIVAGASGNRLDVIATDGTVASTVAAISDTRSTYVAFGSPAINATYIANSGTTIRKLVGTTFTTPSGMPKAKYVGLQTPDNRLVAANIATIPTGSSATASTSLVHFSDSGAPETWSANNYVYLTPGDNQDIQGTANWRNQVFVFKSTKFFVFYGNSVDGTGQPVFNYRQVSGAGVIAPQAIAAAPDGVYFLDRRGVYFTTGGPPTRVSAILDPLFLGGSVPYFQPGTINPSALASATMAWYSGRLYIGIALGTSSTNSHTLVFDPTTSVWLCWDIPMGAMTASASQPGVLLFAYASGTNDVGQYAPNAYTTDAGTAITARYRSSFDPFDWRGRNLRSGISGVDKIVRESLVDGSGTVSYTLSNQWVQPTNLPTARSLTLGTAPQVAQARDRTAVKGRSFSWQASGTAPWSVEKVTLALYGYEPAGLKGDEGN